MISGVSLLLFFFFLHFFVNRSLIRSSCLPTAFFSHNFTSPPFHSRITVTFTFCCCCYCAAYFPRIISAMHGKCANVIQWIPMPLMNSTIYCINRWIIYTISMDHWMRMRQNVNTLHMICLNKMNSFLAANTESFICTRDGF